MRRLEESFGSFGLAGAGRPSLEPGSLAAVVSPFACGSRERGRGCGELPVAIVFELPTVFGVGVAFDRHVVREALRFLRELE